MASWTVGTRLLRLRATFSSGQVVGGDKAESSRNERGGLKIPGILVEANLKLLTFITLLFCNLSFRFVYRSGVLVKQGLSHSRRLRL